MWRKIGNVIFSIILLLALAAGAGSLALGRPVLATIIKSNSMAPVYVRGDVVFLWNWPGEIEEGDVVLFKPREGSLAGEWTMHRVVGEDPDGNYLTKGDAGAATDQQDNLAGPVAREDVFGKAVTIGGVALKIPWIGSLPLKLDVSRAGIQKYVLLSALVLVVGVGAMELTRQSRRRRRGEELDARLVFIGVGTILSVLLIAMTLFQSNRITLIYDVGPDPGIIMGQPLGILTPGQVVSKELSRLKNQGFLPMLALLSEKDPNVIPDLRLEKLPPKSDRTVNIEVHGDVLGSYQSLVEITLVFPLLPTSLIQSLADMNHWLGALAGCMLPGLLVASLAVVEPGSRRRTARDLRSIARWLTRLTR